MRIKISNMIVLPVEGVAFFSCKNTYFITPSSAPCLCSVLQGVVLILRLPGSMEAAGCFLCVNRLKSTLSNVLVCEPFQTPVDCESPPKNVSAEKLPEKVARLRRALLNANTGMRCPQKLKVDIYTHKIVFQNTLNISQNERLSQSPHSRNIASFLPYVDSSTTAR